MRNALHPVLIKNVSGFEIPPWAVMLAIGVERIRGGDLVALKVDSVEIPIQVDSPPLWLINGGNPIGITGSDVYGWGRYAAGDTFWVKYDTSDTPAFGEEWGVEDNQWHITKDSSDFPFTIVGLPDKKLKRVLATYVQSSSDCPNAFRIIVVGNPTTGSFYLNLVLPDGDDDLIINWDDTADEVKTQIEGHAHWDPDYTVETGDGPFPTNSISIQFGGSLSGEHIVAPTVNSITLSGGARTGVRVERACCEEV